MHLSSVLFPNHHFTLVHEEVYVFEDLEVPEELANLSKLYHAHRAPQGPKCAV
jgi:hypothetical protein